jgi:hypothetical protein
VAKIVNAKIREFVDERHRATIAEDVIPAAFRDCGGRGFSEVSHLTFRQIHDVAIGGDLACC